MLKRIIDVDQMTRDEFRNRQIKIEIPKTKYSNPIKEKLDNVVEVDEEFED